VRQLLEDFEAVLAEQAEQEEEQLRFLDEKDDRLNLNVLEAHAFNQKGVPATHAWPLAAPHGSEEEGCETTRALGSQPEPGAHTGGGSSSRPQQQAGMVKQGGDGGQPVVTPPPDTQDTSYTSALNAFPAGGTPVSGLAAAGSEHVPAQDHSSASKGITTECLIEDVLAAARELYLCAYRAAADK
jgi:hypothetical protein